MTTEHITPTRGALQAPSFLSKRRQIMTIETLFGKEEVTSKPRAIKFKQIKAVYETLTVREVDN